MTEITKLIYQVREQIFSNDLPGYIMVDPLLGDPLDRKAADIGHVPRMHWKLPFSGYGLTEAEFPYFIALQGPLDHLLDLSVRIAEREARTESGQRRICGWFASAEVPQVIVGRMKAHIVRRNEDGKRTLVRIYDPRVLRHWPRIFGLDYLPGNVRTWCFLQQPDDLQIIRGSEDDIGPLSEWNPAQWRAVERISLLNQALINCESMDVPQAVNSYKDIDTHIEKAMELGLKTDTDRITFALHRHLINPRIEQHDVIASLIDAAARGDESYTDQTATLSPEVWQQIEAGEQSTLMQGERYG